MKRGQGNARIFNADAAFCATSTFSNKVKCRRIVLANLVFCIPVTPMRKDMILVVLILSGSALLWWPGLIAKLFSFQWFLPWWFQLVIFALGIGLATILSRGRWPRFLVASTVGTFAGVLSAVVIMPDSPP